jgi:hypothetical protein
MESKYDKLNPEKVIEGEVIDSQQLGAYCLFPNEILKDQQAEYRLNEWIEQFNALLFDENDNGDDGDRCKGIAIKSTPDDDRHSFPSHASELENVNTNSPQNFFRGFYPHEKILTPSELCQEWKHDAINLRIIGRSIPLPQTVDLIPTSTCPSTLISTSPSEPSLSSSSPHSNYHLGNLEIVGRHTLLDSKLDQWLDSNERQFDSDIETEEIFAEHIGDSEEILALDAHKEAASSTSSWGFVHGHVVDDNISPRQVQQEEKVDEVVEYIWKELVHSKEAHAIFCLLASQKAERHAKKHIMGKKSSIHSRPLKK